MQKELKLYLGIVTYNENRFSSVLPTLSYSKPTPQQVAAAHNIEYNPETEKEKHLSVIEISEVPVIGGRIRSF